MYICIDIQDHTGIVISTVPFCHSVIFRMKIILHSSESANIPAHDQLYSSVLYGEVQSGKPPYMA